MKTKKLLVSLALLSAAGVAMPASANEMLRPVDGRDLNHFIGSNLFGYAHTNLGVVSQVDPNAGVIGLAGRNGEFAILHVSVLARNGLTLRAPMIDIADIRRASTENLQHPGSTLIRPSIMIEEPPLG